MSIRTGSTKSQAVLGLALLWITEVVLAGSFSVAPVRVSLSANEPSSVLTIRNSGQDETVVQVQANTWSQNEGSDVLEPTTDLIAVPPLFTLPAGGSQVVRVGLRRAPASAQELTYRILLREVPPPPTEDFTGLQVALMLSLPVFVAPPQGAEPELRWNLKPAVDEGIELQLSNDGDAHVQLKKVTLAPPEGEAIEGRDLPIYLLPGQSRAWLVAADSPIGTTWMLTADTDAGAVQTELVVESAN